MKNVFMVLFLVGGFAITGAEAQATCTPCPPQSCMVPCPPPCAMAPCSSACKGSTTSVKVPVEGVASFASFSPEALTTTCNPGKMSKQEIKKCQTKCAPSDANQAQVASLAPQHPVCAQQPAKL